MVVENDVGHMFKLENSFDINYDVVFVLMQLWWELCNTVTMTTLINLRGNQFLTFLTFKITSLNPL